MDTNHSRMKEKLKSIRVISALQMICACVIVILLIAVGSYWIFSSTLLDTIGTNRSDVLSQVGSRMQDIKSSAYTISNLYYNDAGFRRRAFALSDETRAEFADYMDSLTRQYQLSFDQINLEYYVVYLSADGVGYCSVQVPEDYNYINPTIRIWYRDLYEARGDIIDVASFDDRALGLHSFVAARSVPDPQGGIAGYLMICIDERQIYDTYDDIISENSNIYITDDNGDIISSNVSQIVGTHYFHMQNLRDMFDGGVYAVVQMPRHEALFSKYEDAAYGFTVFEETPLDYLLQPVRRSRNILVGIALVVTLLGTALSLLFAGRLTRPILQLRDYVLRVRGGEGELDVPLVMDSYTEINTLSQGIRQMLARIRELIDNVKRKEEQKRKMQYHLLQAQINPHFMYNTLFSIKCVVDMNENRRASQMLSAFIQLLRSSLTDPDSMTTLRQQMDALHQYADLQKFRYGDQFEIVIEYEDDLADCLLPSLLVQPLVENAIVHGVARTGSGVIAVTARTRHGQIELAVEDNGVGMTAQQIDRIFTQGEDPGAKPHIGLKNIHERLQLTFGSGSGLHIESAPGEGTKVTANIPILHRQEESS